MMNAISNYILCSIEASLYLSPCDDGLQYDEIKNVLNRLDFLEGEINDGISDLISSGQIYQKSNKYFIDSISYYHFWFSYKSEYEPTKPELLDDILKYLQLLIKKQGRNKAIVSQDILVGELMSQGYSTNEAILGIKRLIYGRILENHDDQIKISNSRTNTMLYTELMNQHKNITKRPYLLKILPIVGEVISSRNTGRLKSSNSMDNFNELLGELSFENFNDWYFTTQREWISINYNIQPKSYLILSAALCESMLALTVNFAQDKSLSMLKKLDTNARKWKFQNLIDSACTGSSPIINNDKLKNSLLELNEYRKGIHAGFLINKYQNRKIPINKSEEAEFAKETVLKLARRVVDWILNEI